jgi:hypothetical protein
MAGISADEMIRQLVAVLHEAVIGPPEQWSYFTDNRPDAGYEGTLSSVTAEEASRMISGTSIAAHTHHAAWAMACSAAWIRGDPSRWDWAESWTVSAVDDEAWSGLQDRLRLNSNDLRAAIESHALVSDESFGGAVGAIAHAAYHLGAIRQKIARLRTS